jgi:precorrin-8X/cobalt-precorrin-8 methylmutase
VLKGGTPIVADVEMICVGLSAPRLQHFGLHTHHYISDPDVIEQASAENTTRAVQAMRKAHRLGKLDGAIVGIGNAPTALIELVRLIREEGGASGAGYRHAGRLRLGGRIEGSADDVDDMPWVAIKGRKGGSTLVVAAIHACCRSRKAKQQGSA